jgi:hypothetical protein
VDLEAGEQALKNWAHEGSLLQERARAVRRLAERLLLTLAHEKDLAAEIRELEVRFAPLTRLWALTSSRLAAWLRSWALATASPLTPH